MIECGRVKQFTLPLIGSEKLSNSENLPREFFNITILVFFLFITASCKSADQRYLTGNTSGSDMKEEICLVAEVRWISLEGGFYGLVTDDGRKFTPLNLPETFRKEGLKIRVKGRVKNVVSIYMWGIPFEIYEIDVYSP